jgi:hypothetical protein
MVDVEVRDEEDVDGLGIKGSDWSPRNPGWHPQSNIMVLPLNFRRQQERPTSLPAPSGINSNVSSPWKGNERLALPFPSVMSATGIPAALSEAMARFSPARTPRFTTLFIRRVKRKESI